MSSNYKVAIKRLVLVDCAGFSYTEIPLDDHAILLARGNIGKSSIMNSLRLFLLPEENLRKGELKFGFKKPDKSDFYRNEQSYEHYFPSARSFLILETENAAGTHCQILHRSDVSNLGYRRIFVPVAYSELRDIFWNVDDTDGIGFARPELSVNGVVKACKALSSKTQVVADKRQLRSMLYSNDLLDKDRSLYTILPMANVDQQKVESLRTLIRMLFEVSHDPKSMALAVANIIETQKNYERDRFDFNISEFLEDREKLEASDQKIKKIQSARDEYNSLVACFDEYAPQKMANEFNLWMQSLISARMTSNTIISKLTDERTKLKTKTDDLKKAAGATKTERTEINGILKDSRSEAKTLEVIIEKAKKVIGQYFGQDVSEIKEIINEGRQGVLDEMDSLKNDHANARTRKELQSRIEELDKRIEKLQEKLANQEFEISNQVSENEATVLNTLNKKLSSANPGRTLSEEERSSIHDFCGLFDLKADASRIFFFDSGIVTDRLPGESTEDKIKTDQRERKESEEKLNVLSDASKDPEEKERQLRKKAQQLSEYDKDLKILREFDGAEKLLGRIQEKLEVGDEKFAKLDALYQEQHAEYTNVQEEYAKKGFELQTEKTANANYSAWIKRLERLADIQNKLSVSPADIKKGEMLKTEDMDESGIDDLETRCHRLGKVRQDILNGIRSFWEEDILDDEHRDMIQSRPTHENISSAWADLKEIYNNLDHRIKTLEDQRRTHNELVENYRTSLRKNREFISNVESQLNRSLESVQINDLAEIRVTIECDEAFEALVRESETINPYSSKSLSDAFYDKLKTFMNRFFTETEDGTTEYRLTMERVIRKISYQTRKENQSQFDDKAQSNSTTSLINLSLVQNLLKSLLDRGFDYSLPAVLDEVASVDIGQIESLLKRIKEEGFRLFGAATHSASGALVLEIGRHFKLDEMRTSQPYHEERPLVYWGGPEGLKKADIELSEWITLEQKPLMDIPEGRTHVK